MRVLGIDYGDRRSGVALSDPGGRISFPRETVEGEEELVARVVDLVHREGVDLVVLGLPKNMDGSLGPKAKQVLEFKKKLTQAIPVPVSTWDERLTTVQAEKLLQEGGLSLKKRAARVDKMAAQILLQSFLDAQNRST